MATEVALVLIAVLLLAVSTVGVQYLARTTPVREVRLLEDGPALDAADPQFRETFATLTNTALIPGNRIELLLNGDETYERILQALRGAERVITWQVFWFRPGRLADEIGSVLAERARAGVSVLFLRDVFGSDVSGDYLDALRSAGVEVAPFRAVRFGHLYKLQQRTHARSVIVDGRIGFTGGFGVDDRWLGDGRQKGQWRDTSIVVEGPIVDRLQSSFISNWAEATGELLVGPPLFDPGSASGTHPADDGSVRGHGDVLAGVVYGAPALGSTTAERFFALSITGARHRLYLTSAYFVPVRQFRAMLEDAARRGVDVRILTPGGNTDQPATLYAARAHYETLLGAGVRIYEYRPTMIHAKTLVVDGSWCAIGSMNFDNRSIALNDEVALVAQDAELGGQLESIFMDDLDYAEELRLDAFRRRGAVSRVREAVSARFSRWL